MIFAPDCDADGAVEMARRLQARVAPRAFPAFSVSIGIAVQDHAGAGFDRLYHDADAALYHAKSAGKSCYIVFEPSMSPDVRAARNA